MAEAPSLELERDPRRSVRATRERLMTERWIWPVIACVAFAQGCDRRRAVVVEAPVYLYATETDCLASLNIGPNDPRISGPEVRGVIAELPPGTALQIRGEAYGKDFRCFRVSTDSAKGAV
jgi:hypothetical protein